jgi:heme exporter protein D
MSEWGSVALAYVIVFVSIALLAVRSAQRGRRLARQVPDEQRRWM